MHRSILVVGVLLAGLLSCATAAARQFPRPTCAWVSATAVSRALGDRVIATGGSWTNKRAPMLTCSYQEVTPNVQLDRVPILRIQYAEYQYYKPVPGAKPLRGLGSCIKRSSICPKLGVAAWMLSKVHTRRTVGSPAARGTTTGAPPGPVVERFVGEESLFVQDGLNALGIAVSNPGGPLNVRDETAALERLARGVLRRFYWN